MVRSEDRLADSGVGCGAAAQKDEREKDYVRLLETARASPTNLLQECATRAGGKEEHAQCSFFVLIPTSLPSTDSQCYFVQMTLWHHVAWLRLTKPHTS